MIRPSGLSKALRGATDKELADFMAGFHSGSREWILCQQEIARRQRAPAVGRVWIAIGVLLTALVLLVIFNLAVGHG
jgi:ABC-type polysaccharide/polyol phosphate export permease